MGSRGEGRAPRSLANSYQKAYGTLTRNHYSGNQKNRGTRVSICGMPSSQPAIFRLFPGFIGLKVVALFFVVVALLAAFLVLV